MKRTISGIICAALCIAGSSSADSFNQVKSKLSGPGCLLLEFISIIESDVFDQVDSARGTAYLAHDGRYNVMLGLDQYLYDHEHVYTYSGSSNQVVIEKIDSGLHVNRYVSLITRLDDFYETYPIEPGHRYRLVRKPGMAGDHPDSMIVSIDPASLEMERIEYLDVNDELNRIVFVSQKSETNCDENRFQPAFPDSVERVKL